ncbi:beta-ketoacyl synthase, partial [Cobetia marina]
MSHLPVIVGMGGVNAAGRTSGHQAFRRTVLETLSETDRQETLLGLASLMNLARCDEQGQWFDAEGQPAEAQALAARLEEQVLAHSLIRRIEDERFNDAGIPANRQSRLTLTEDLSFTLRSRQLPEQPPAA